MESARASGVAQSERVVDVVSFTQWAAALDADRQRDPSVLGPNGEFLPKPGYLSNFLYHRFRPEFRPAVDAWLRSKPLTDPAAPATPFATPEYRLASDQQAQALQQRAEAFAATARAANRTATNYVLTGVLFASTLFFIGVSTRVRPRVRFALLTLAGASFLTALAVILSYPVKL